MERDDSLKKVTIYLKKKKNFLRNPQNIMILEVYSKTYPILSISSYYNVCLQCQVNSEFRKKIFGK